MKMITVFWNTWLLGIAANSSLAAADWRRFRGPDGSGSRDSGRSHSNSRDPAMQVQEIKGRVV